VQIPPDGSIVLVHDGVRLTAPAAAPRKDVPP
jgi:hypothetical protein